MPDSKATLPQTLESFQRSLENQTIDLLNRYRKLLWHHNEQMNLTRHTTLEQFVGRDVVDSLELSQCIDPGQRVLDIGTGGGVPGLILAICRADLRVSVCESTQKKARAVEQMVKQLQLPVEVFACRAEEALKLRTFDTLTARAVAPLSKILTWLEPYWESFDQLLLVKGRKWVDERRDARHRGLLKNLHLRKVTAYETRGHDAPSVVLRLTRSEP